MISEYPRVRFAPSPTGYLHVGGLRTALYNYLFAKHNNGRFILRIEDTDRNRYVEGAVENLIAALNWAGLDYDEGPSKGGDYGPYMQSERLEIYKMYADELLANKKAYYCFCTPDRLKEVKEEQVKHNLQGMYDKHCVNLTEEEISERLKAGEPYVIRLNVPKDEVIRFNDLIRGEVEFSTNTVDDQVLIKSDGYPTYHLANVVDDHLMKITHVIRGEEWLPSTPKHVLLYNYLGWELPSFAHLPLLLNQDKSKLSKRQGDVAVEDYRAKGYLKESLVNFVALLGWTAGDDVEYYEIEELIKKFDINRVNKSGAVFNIEKLNWLNAEHLRNKSDSDLLILLREELEKTEYNNSEFSDGYLIEVIISMRERISFMHELIEKAPYFFEEPKSYDENLVKKRWKSETNKLLVDYVDEITKLEITNKETYETTLKTLCEKRNIGAGQLIHPIRLALSGVGAGPGLYDIMVILGKNETIKRIKTAIEKISV